MMAVSLVDESLPLPGETGEVRTVNLNIFSKQREEMPQIQFAGDVLRAHRVKVQEWKEELQLMGLRASSYVVFRADSNNRQQTDNLTVLPTAKHEFSWTEEDKDRFIKLWQWGQRRIFSHPTMKESQSFKLYQMLWHTDNRVEKYQDSIARGDVTLLVCAILEMAPEKRSSATPRGFLRVWDGTGPPKSDPFPDDCITNGYNASRDGDPPSCVVEKLAGIMQELRRIRQNPNLQEPKALTGRLGNVAIWEEPFWELVQKAVKVGSFIRLRNVHDTRIPNGIRRYLMVYSKSYLTPLPNMTYEVVRMLEAHNDRLINNDPMNPSSGVLPLGRARGDNIRRSNSNNSSTASVSLASLATLPISTLFSGRVRIVGLLPSLSDLGSSDAGGGLSQICGAGRNFAVQLSDHDDHRPPLDVILSGNSVAAANILGMPPNEATKAQNNQQVMSRLGRITSNSSPCWWNAKVRSVALEGAKYFVLESIERL
jgi:Telomeric single stranded DNA binding POT1/CDC13